MVWQPQWGSFLNWFIPAICSTLTPRHFEALSEQGEGGPRLALMQCRMRMANGQRTSVVVTSVNNAENDLKGELGGCQKVTVVRPKHSALFIILHGNFVTRHLADRPLKVRRQT